MVALPFAILSAIGLACTPFLYSEEDTQATPWVAPENTWYSEAPPADLEAGGFGVGEVLPDFRAMDQFGDEVSLWQFYGLLIVVDISTLWCGPCRELAEGTEETYQEFIDDGVMYLTLMPEDLESNIPDLDDLQLWVDSFAITAPVLSDTHLWSYDVVPPGSTEGYPGLMLVGRDMRVIEPEISPKDDAAIRGAISSNL